jgi:hypothetical protein
MVLTLPAIQEVLPLEAREVINSYCGAVALALSVHWRLRDRHKS